VSLAMLVSSAVLEERTSKVFMLCTANLIGARLPLIVL